MLWNGERDYRLLQKIFVEGKGNDKGRTDGRLRRMYVEGPSIINGINGLRKKRYLDI